jgi:hypothetical protein
MPEDFESLAFEDAYSELEASDYAPVSRQSSMNQVLACYSSPELPLRSESDVDDLFSDLNTMAVVDSWIQQDQHVEGGATVKVEAETAATSAGDEAAYAQAQADSTEQHIAHAHATLGLLSDCHPAREQSRTYAELHRIGGARDKKKYWEIVHQEVQWLCKLRGLDDCPDLQRQLATRKKMMAQKESLLRFLHIARANDLIVVLEEATPSRSTWGAFRVMHGDFFAQLVRLFGFDDASDVPVNSQRWRTMNTAFDRLGFMPNGTKFQHDIWTKAYRGQLDFVARPLQ